MLREDAKATINTNLTAVPGWYKATSHFIEQNKDKSTIAIALRITVSSYALFLLPHDNFPSLP